MKLGKLSFTKLPALVFMVTWSQKEPLESQKKYPVDKYTKESNCIALFLLHIGSI